MSLSKVTLAPATPGDYLTISKLVEITFADDEFGTVAFGPKRMTPAADERRAKMMAKPPKSGQTKHEMKAVMIAADGSEEIVGYANWIICVGRGGSEEEKVRLGTRDGWVQEEKEKEEEKIMEGENGDEEGYGNAKFRDDVRSGMDKILARSTEGKDYMSLNMLIVVPGYQRRGIGAMLVEDGLRIADETGLQLILGASPKGVGLYKKYGCVEVEVIKTNLWEYDGGEGLGVDTQTILHRPALSPNGT